METGCLLLQGGGVNGKGVSGREWGRERFELGKRVAVAMRRVVL